MIQTPELQSAMRENLDRSDGKLCGCPECRAMLIGAFAVDLDRHHGDTGNGTAALESLAITAVRFWLHNGQSLENLVSLCVLKGAPEAEYMNINVQLTPLSDDEVELFELPAEGSA